MGNRLNISEIKNFGQLRKSGYKPQSIKDELRSNLIRFLQQGTNPFEGIIGYDETVIPDLQTAILSRHDIILLGLRGQAKTKIARLMINLLDEWIPALYETDLNDDPYNPISFHAKEIIATHGDESIIKWIHRNERYTEKLATPDVSIADLIGDIDPIKAASLKLPYSDERVIHFGLIPRSHRGIFVVNELPDLQARIQVALFNILQENDIQIRGFKVRLPLDIQFVFTANPEDYTNRGAIVTPLKDRIDSQILTHYAKTIEHSKNITEQEANLADEQKKNISASEIMKDLVEQVAFEARESEYIDEKSGVSARLTISAYENLISTAERRRIINKESSANLRISDIFGIIPSITGKVELVYEGEQEGSSKVAQILIGKAIRNLFIKYFPNPDTLKKSQSPSPYQQLISWFKKGNHTDILINSSEKDYRNALIKVESLEETVRKLLPDLNKNLLLIMMEFLLYGLSEFSLLSRSRLERGLQFKDMLSSMFTLSQEEEQDDEDSSMFSG